MKQLHHKGPQRGAALLIALALTAIAAVIASDILDRGLWSSRQSLVNSRLNQARQLVLGLEDWGIKILNRDYQQSAPTYRDGLADLWSQPLPATEIPGGLISGQLLEQSGRFNINSLVDINGQVDPLARQRFLRLLDILDLDQALAEQLIDWLDPDGIASPLGGEDAAYSGQVPVRLPANMPMSHVSELRQLPALDPAAFARLAGHVYAAPASGGGININTAGEEVLMALADDLDREAARQIVRNRGDGFSRLEDFLDLPVFENKLIDAAGLTVQSQDFLMVARLQMDDLDMRYESLLRRQGNQYHVYFRRQAIL